MARGGRKVQQKRAAAMERDARKKVDETEAKRVENLIEQVRLREKNADAKEQGVVGTVPKMAETEAERVENLIDQVRLHEKQAEPREPLRFGRSTVTWCRCLLTRTHATLNDSSSKRRGDALHTRPTTVRFALVQAELKQQFANCGAIGAALGVVVGFLGAMNKRLKAIDGKLDQLGADVKAMHADLLRLVGKPALEVLADRRALWHRHYYTTATM